MKTQVISTTTKVIQNLALGVVAVSILLVIWIGYLMFTPVNVLKVKVPLPAAPTEVMAGGTVNLNFDYCKRKDLESHIKVDFVGDYIIPTLSTNRHFPVGCHAENLAISIPAGTPEGVYTIRLGISYDVTILREETYVFDSVEVKVINPEQQPTVEVGNSDNTR